MIYLSEKGKALSKKLYINILFSALKMVCGRVLIPFRGWKVFSRQKVVFAGMSLSFLYMTVLGFDGITTGTKSLT